MAELRVGIDAGPMLGRQGISGYVGPLVRTLLLTDRQTRYDLVVRRGWLGAPGLADLAALAPVTRLRVPDRVLALWWDRLGRIAPVQRQLWQELDVFLATIFVTPVLERGRVVAIVYDLTPLRLPELFPDHPAFRERVARVLRRSAAVVAISQRTRDDLVEMLGADPERTHVIHPGRSPAFRPTESGRIDDVRRRHGIVGPYVLYVGALGRHKNVGMLLRAYERARLDGGLDARLVIAGPGRWGAQTLRVLERLEVRRDVVLTGEVADADLPALYTGADVFVFPSRWEGFGLPVLEAMACGTPVIVSDRGALPEVAGEAGLRLPPDDVDAWAGAMRRLVGDRAERMRRAVLARSRAERFSWERSAGELARLLRLVAAQPTRRGARPAAAFYDADYFEGKSRESVPHRREVIYPLAQRTARFLWRRFRPARVLDLGCAKGFLVEALRAEGAHVALGVDISEYAVSRREAGAGDRLLVADAATGIPLRSSSLDLVTALDLFEHLPDPQPVLGEIRRILQDGGAAYLKICHPRHPNARRDPTHVNVQPLGYWRREFRRAGFACERLYEADLVPPEASAQRLRAWVRRWREWAVLGTPADYKFLLRKRRA